MDDFPSKVTLFEDGIYRWRYDMDMWHNRYLLKLLMRILCLILGIPALFILAMLCRQALPLLNRDDPWSEIMMTLHNDLTLLAVVVGMLAGMIVLALIIYAVCAAAMHGIWRLRFQMDDTAVALVRDPEKMRALNALGTIAAVTGLLVGKPGDSVRIGSTLAMVNSNGTTRFESVRRVKCIEACDVIDLREWFGMNQIYIPEADYALVRDFILARVRDSARR